MKSYAKKEENDKTGCNFNFGHECSSVDLILVYEYADGLLGIICSPHLKIVRRHDVTAFILHERDGFPFPVLVSPTTACKVDFLKAAQN